MLCLTGVYLSDITNAIFFSFALECESSERLLFLFLFSLVLKTCALFTCNSDQRHNRSAARKAAWQIWIEGSKREMFGGTAYVRRQPDNLSITRRKKENVMRMRWRFTYPCLSLPVWDLWCVCVCVCVYMCVCVCAVSYTHLTLPTRRTV